MAVAEARPADIREPLLAFALAVAVAVGVVRLSQWVPWVGQVMHGLIACVFLLGPQVAARLSGRPFDGRAAGITIQPVRRGLRTLGLALAVTWPAFIVGFVAYHSLLCRSDGWVSPVAAVAAPFCPAWRGLVGFELRLPDGFLMGALSQLLVVAIPEEVFFRGYLSARFEARWPSRRKALGVPVGPALLLSSILFALGHFVVDLQPARLAVFFPALVFGWMRQRSGSVAPAAVFHALCNLLSEVLHTSFS